MNIYLMRHAESVYQDSDDLSPLSEKGAQDIERIANFISPLRLPAKIFHSQKLRAKQTAERLAQGLIVLDEITERSDLNPEDSVITMAEELNEMETDVLLVGHMPFMGKLASQLVYRNSELDVVTFHKGTLVCLTQVGYRQWAIDWVIHPDLIS